VYWVVHGSIDWFWEFPALGAPAFALLGLAAGLLPRPAARLTLTLPRPGRGWRPRVLAARLAAAPALVLALAVVPAASLAAPWLAELEQNTAVATWTTDPGSAFDHLDTAASLNPLSPTPRLFGGSIALRLGDRARAERYFRQALARDPDDAYAHLELGALLAQGGNRGEALAILARATRLDPRDDLARGVLADVRRGRPVDIAHVNRELAARSAQAGR
jgi:tetratricopeptide (TPR) repeat protein